MNDQEKEKPEPCPYGYCPECLAPGFNRERRLFGDDTCTSGHKYPSAAALKGPFTRQQTELVALVRSVKEGGVSYVLSDEDVAGALKGKAELDRGQFVTLEELRSQVNMDKATDRFPRCIVCGLRHSLEVSSVIRGPGGPIGPLCSDRCWRALVNLRELFKEEIKTKDEELATLRVEQEADRG